jgi:peptidoglycan/xylan/chitin deacetylase (PgdA/CDA1 family)
VEIKTMFFNMDIKGDRLPPNTLCLTYDDGPGETRGGCAGPRTAELGQFLSERGIPATFFVIGRHAEQYRDLVQQLKEWGHLVGNHTYTHPGLVALVEAGGDAVEELSRTERAIGGQVSQPITFFRAPYGNWRQKVQPDGREHMSTSIVAKVLNNCGTLRNVVGPINWDISGHDYDYWNSGRSAEECAREYLDRIVQIGRGIVLMHDSSEDEAARRRNLTYSVTRLIVPVLEGQGYAFVRLDAIPQVQSAMMVSRQVALLASNHRFVSWRAHRGALIAAGLAIGFSEQFGVVDLGQDRVALRASNGAYLSAGGGSEADVRAEAFTVGDPERFHREEIGDHRVTLRASGGLYLSPGREDGRLLARASRTSAARVFTEYDLFEPYMPARSAMTSL